MFGLLLGLIGGAVGYAAGVGFAVGWFIGSTIGSMIDGPGDTTGPRLDSLDANVSSYDQYLPLVYGASKLQGNFIWAPDLVEVERSKKVGGFLGIGGSEYTWFEYYGNFAVAFADGPGDVIKLWFNDRLILDRDVGADTGISDYPVIFAGDSGGGSTWAPPSDSGEGTITIYRGSETQLPDPTMTEWLGAGNVPAHRGVIYVVVTGLALKEFGNRLPQVYGLVTTSMSRAPLTEIGWGNGNEYHFQTPDGRYVYSSGAVYDRATGASWVVSNPGLCGGVYSWMLKTANVTGDGWTLGELTFAYVWEHNLFAINTVTGATRLVARATSANIGRGVINPWSGIFVNLTAAGQASAMVGDINNDLANACDYATAEGHGTIYGPRGIYNAAPYKDGALILLCYTGSSEVYIMTYAGATDSSARVLWGGYNPSDYTMFPDAFGYHHGLDRVFIGLTHAVNGTKHLMRLKLDYLTSAWRVESISPTLAARGGVTNWMSISCVKTHPLNLYVQTGGKEYQINLVDWTQSTVYDYGQTMSGHSLYNPLNHSVWCVKYLSSYVEVLLDRAGATTTTLKAVVDDLCERAGLSASMRNTDALAGETVWGYAVNNRDSIRRYIEPLALGYGFDAVETGGLVKFVMRDGATAKTLTEADIVPDRDGELLKIDRVQEPELPYILNMVYTDPDKNWESVTTTAKRYDDLIETRESRDITLPFSLPNSKALEVCGRLFNTAWVERVNYEFTLGPDSIALDPTDIVDVSVAGNTFRVRILSTELQGDRTVAVRAIEDKVSTYTISTSGGGSLADVPGLHWTGVITASLLDAPTIWPDTLRLDTPIIGFAADLSGSTGDAVDAVISTTAVPEPMVYASLSERTTMGVYLGGLSADASAYVWDDASSMVVNLLTGNVLTSATKTDLLQSPRLNLVLVDNELIQFATATQTPGTNTWTLTGLLRGRFGTEQCIGTHLARGTITLMARDELALIPVGLNQLIDGFAMVSGRPDRSVDLLALTSPQASLTPLAPANARAALSGSDWVITWGRRVRGLAEWYGMTLPLNESSQSYEVEILHPTTGATLRTLTADSETTTWTAAQQTTDMGTSQREVKFRVRQMGAVAGRWTEGYNKIPKLYAILESPADIDGLIHWWDASDTATMFADTAKTVPITNATTVAAWVSKAGAGTTLEQATSTARPTYYSTGLDGTRPCVTFASTHWLRSLTGGGDFDHTFIVVVDDVTTPSTGNRSFLTFGISGTSLQSSCVGVYDSGTNNAIGWGGGVGVNYPRGGIGLKDSAKHVVGKRYADVGTTSVLSIDATANVQTRTDFNYAISGTDILMNGANGAPPSSSYTLGFKIVEAVIYNRSLTDAEYLQLRDYFASKWGI